MFFRIDSLLSVRPPLDSRLRGNDNIAFCHSRVSWSLAQPHHQPTAYYHIKKSSLGLPPSSRQ